VHESVTVLVDRCPEESGALFLYRKLPSVPEPVLFAAPPLRATDEHMEGWLKDYNEALEAVDPEASPKEAAADAGRLEALPLCTSLIMRPLPHI
jgi:fatty acid synthase